MLRVAYRDVSFRALVCALAIIASACAPQQTVAPTPAVAVAPMAAADATMARGDFAGAAAGLRTAAAKRVEPEATRLLLAALLIEADLGRDAVLDTLRDTPPSDPAAAAMNRLALAVRDVARGVPGETEMVLNALPTASLTSHQRGLYLRTLGAAQLARGDALNAAVNFTQAERYPLPTGRRTALTHDIWSAISRSDPSVLAERLDGALPHVPGWLALLSVAQAQTHDPTALASQLADWQLHHPRHPAQEILVDELVEQAEEQAIAPSRIALLLPLDGALAAPAAAIRDGFVAMHFATRRGQAEPAIAVDSATTENVIAVAGRAVAEGAGLLVGPLEKPAVELLQRSADITVPVLALNTPETVPATVPNARFYRFPLRPEDEACDLADRAWADGLRRMTAFVPNTELGNRLLRAFRERWQARGGTLLAEARFVSDVDSYAAAVQQTLGLRDSEQRAANLRRLLKRQFIFEPRARPDIDGVMLAAYPLDARQILPQFRYFGAGHLTVYATSLVFSGRVDPAADQDLDGVRFGDMPWLLRQRDAELRRVLAAYWDRSPSTERFFAFGADAYRLLPYLAQMRAQPTLRVNGATGDLAMDSQGIVRRALSWAVFQGGAPRPLATATLTASPAP